MLIITILLLFQIFFFIMVFLFSVFVLTSINKEKDDQVFVKVSIFYVYIWGIEDVAEEVISFLVSSVVFLHYVATQH